MANIREFKTPNLKGNDPIECDEELFDDEKSPLQSDYEVHKLEWLGENGWTLAEVVSEVVTYAINSGIASDLIENTDAVFEAWEEYAISEEQIYESFEEFIENEYEEDKSLYEL